MKECMVTITLLGMLVMLAARMSSAHPIYGLTSLMQDDPFALSAGQEQHGFKRGFWDKRSSEETEDLEGFGGYPLQQLQWNKRNYQEKRGFGSMMPAYLVHLYRPDIPVLPPNSLFSPTRPSSERGKRSNHR
ncbi:uncharacterized protein [Macrobrachium rosenbergii]|uniref:uncharacterized protein n=1 Tax=Macrobrachium rosenbergii TaxID=79674 RepID=UPI0034D54576